MHHEHSVAAMIRLLHTITHENALLYLTDPEFPVNYRFNDGETILFKLLWRIAIFRLDNPWSDQSLLEQNVRLLLEAGANPNYPCDVGLYPLHLASSEDLVEMLIEHGANLECRMIHGQRSTPLMHFIINDQIDSNNVEYPIQVIRALLRNGADVNAKHWVEDRNTYIYPITLAHPSIVPLLLEYGARVEDAQYTWCKTVFFENTLCADLPEMKKGEILLRAGADPHADGFRYHPLARRMRIDALTNEMATGNRWRLPPEMVYCVLLTVSTYHFHNPGGRPWQKGDLG